MNQGKSDTLTEKFDLKDKIPWISLCKSILFYNLHLFLVFMIPRWLNFQLMWTYFASVAVLIFISLYILKRFFKINDDLIKAYPKVSFTLFLVFYYFLTTIYWILSYNFSIGQQIGLTAFLALILIIFWHKEIINKLRGIK
jgi:hypothetical protein